MTTVKPKRARRAAARKRAAASVTHVAIIGAGRGGTALMEIFAQDPLVRIVGIAEINPRAAGLKLARRLHIPITRDYRELLEMERVDLIIDVSGNPDVGRVLLDFHRMGVTIIGGASAKFMWELIEARIRATAEIERTLNQYQTLYRLYVKESETKVSEERTQIACEIHDGLVQSLAGLSFKLDLCQELLKKDPGAAAEALRETKAGLKTAIQEARQVIVNLRPVHYDRMELIPALTSYLKSYESQSHVKTEFSVAGDETTLFPKTKVFLFRIVQEALSNVQKHAKADRVAVQIAIGRDTLTATIADNGVGFDVESVSRDPEKWDHFGLRGILERARLVGGQAVIESKKGRGTRVLITVPLVERETRQNGKN
jgi:two-component system sensor histidine kinase DegS